MRLIRKTREMCRLIRKTQADVIDAHLISAGVVSVLAGFITRTPVTVTLYDAGAPELSFPLSRLVYQLIYSLSTAIVTDSKARADQLRRHMPRRTPVWIIPNGMPQAVSEKDCVQMRQILGLPGDPKIKVIGQVSAVVPYKGLLVLLDAARLVLQQEPDIAFLIVGYMKASRNFKEVLEKRAIELGIAERVRIVSYPGVIADPWAAIDIHVHASLLDSLPNAIIEGMSLGKPAVVTSTGGCAEAVDHGKTGLVVPPGDHVALANALLELIRNPETANALGQAAYERYCERYRAETMTRDLEKALFDLVQSGRKNGRRV
jgi:glycosyltransferase involved in cell wall biosynthesis